MLDEYADGDHTVARFTVIPRDTGPPPYVEGLLAGAAEVDITPPPGMPKAGHSRHGVDGVGFRTRLRARVIHLRAGTTSLALVQCDLHAGSALLQHLVAEAVADTDVKLPGLFIGATHTHAGPGQFHGSDFYNRFSSNRAGFDPLWTRFLVDRIASAVREAVETRRPARLAVGATEVWGLTRNRSLDAYVRNPSVADGRTAGHRAYAAVNPWLHLLRVDTADGVSQSTPLAAMAVFSIHGTGISARDRSYNADVWAYLTGELRHRVEAATGVRPIVGAVQGTHGDMTPAVTPGQLVFPEAERIGRGIGEAAAALHAELEPALTDDVELAAGLRELDLATRPTIGGLSLADPAIGAATLAGARENTVPVVDLIPPFRGGFPKPAHRGPHGAKWITGSRWLQPKLLPPASFPSVLPFQLLRIGSMALLGTPFEVTVEAGRGIEAAVRQALGPTDIDQLVVSSVANEYTGYLTTPDEYAHQCYEGASTLYGPHSQPYVAAGFARLAAEVVKTGRVADHLPTRRFSLRIHRYLPTPTGSVARRTVPDPPRFFEATVREAAHWELRWRDVPPGDLHWHEPIARVEVWSGDGWTVARREGRPVDDQGWWLGISHLGPSRHPASDGHVYAARWYGPDLSRRHRFVLLANAGQPELATPGFD